MCLVLLFFFFKQKTAYEMRMSDWSSDVCSSDLLGPTVLRRLRVDDAEAVYRRYAGDPEVTRFLSFRTHDGVEDAAGFCTLMQVEWEAGRAFTFVMLEPGDPVPFGSIGVRIDEFHAVFGYAMARDRWGRGHRSEGHTSELQSLMRISYAVSC